MMRPGGKAGAQLVPGAGIDVIEPEPRGEPAEEGNVEQGTWLELEPGDGQSVLPSRTRTGTATRFGG